MAGAELIEPGYHMENGQAKNQIEIKKENNQNNISSIEREREREREREGEREKEAGSEINLCMDRLLHLHLLKSSFGLREVFFWTEEVPVRKRVVDTTKFFLLK